MTNPDELLRRRLFEEEPAQSLFCAADRKAMIYALILGRRAHRADRDSLRRGVSTTINRAWD